MPLSLDKLWDWWLSPLSGADVHTLDAWIVWHARIMVLAWAILLPLGALAARYFKVLPQQDWPREVDNRTWWNTHRALQYGGVILMLAGVALAWNKTSQASSVAVWHGYLGWSVTTLGVLQVVGAWLRGSKGGPTDVKMRGDHYDMTNYRFWFEGIHKTCGWLAIMVAVVTICLGLLAADAPRWMALVLTVWWLGLFVIGYRLQKAGRCIDTYQAIWGPDRVHPGNQRQHIGWGARRPNLNQEKT
jgi:hypothetical protein